MGKFMSLLGTRCKYILESTFDWVAPVQVVYVAPSGATAVLNAITHDEVLRNRREHLDIGNAGAIIDKDSKRVIFKTQDILNLGIARLDPAGHLLMDGVRFDFSVSEPFISDDVTPIAGASYTFTVVYVRRAIELTQSKPVPTGTRKYGFGTWEAQT